MDGISDEEFKRLCPELHKSLKEQWEKAGYWDIYGMNTKCRHSGDYYQILDKIDNRTPLMFYRICEGRFNDGRPCGNYFNYN